MGPAPTGARNPPPTEPFDVPAPDGAQIGFRWDGATLLSLIEIDENPQAMTVMEPGTTVSGEVVPVQALVDCLRQFDITLDSIDIISQGARSQGHTAVAAVYDAVLGPLPAIAQRTVWVAVRFDPSQCAEAVRRRGGGREGILRTATTATRRVANRLTEAGLRPRILTASGIAHATNQLSDGVESRRPSRKRGKRAVKAIPAVQLRSRTRDAHHGGPRGAVDHPQLLDDGVPVTANHGDPGMISIRGLARFDSEVGYPRRSARADPPARPSVLGAGVQPADSATNPARRALGLRWSRPPVCKNSPCLRRDAVRSSVPTRRAARSRCPCSARRSIGSRSAAHCIWPSRRCCARWPSAPGCWCTADVPRCGATWSNEVGRHDLLWVADFNRGAIQAGADRNYSVEMFDGVPSGRSERGSPASWSPPPNAAVTPNADVALSWFP